MASDFSEFERGTSKEPHAPLLLAAASGKGKTKQAARAGTERVPSIASLKWNYPTESKDDLAKEMGFEGRDLASVIEDWSNTCAIRLSYCLLKCGVSLGLEPRKGGETRVRTGQAKGKHFWMSQNELSNQLIETFGKPTYRGTDKEELIEQIGRSGGVISFMDLRADRFNERYPGGHIDVVYHSSLKGSVERFVGSFVDSYNLKIDEVSRWPVPALLEEEFKQATGFSNRCARAQEIRFWRSDG